MAAVRDDWKSKPVEMIHFVEASKEVRPSISEQDAMAYLSIAERILRRQSGKKKEEQLPAYV